MPTSYVTLIPEFIVPITSANQLDSISRNFGEFQLAADLDLGNGWDKDGDNPHEIDIYGEFDGKGHQITYAGTTCLFNQVTRQGAVRHLRVKGNVSTSSNVIGGITALNIGIIEVVFNNSVLGMVHQWQELFYGGRYSQTILKDKVDYCAVAKALGCGAIRVTSREEFAPAFEKALAFGLPDGTRGAFDFRRI